MARYYLLEGPLLPDDTYDRMYPEYPPHWDDEQEDTP